MVQIVRCPHADLLESRLNVFATEDGAHVEFCDECTADLLDSLIGAMTAQEFETAHERMKKEADTAK